MTWDNSRPQPKTVIDTVLLNCKQDFLFEKMNMYKFTTNNTENLRLLTI